METAAPPPAIDRLGVNFYAPIGVVSGLGSAARGYLAALRAAAVPVAVVPVHELFLHQRSIGSRVYRERPRYSVSIAHINADSVHRFMHFHGRSFARASYKIALWTWELPALREEWWSEIRHFDEIWVPSTFCQRAVQAVTGKPVVVVPHVVSPNETAQPGWRAKLRIGDDEFVFLYVFDATSGVERKNPQCLVDAFEAAFSEHDRVRLVLKVSNAEQASNAKGGSAFSQYLNSIAQRGDRYVVVRQSLQPEELAGLFRAANCYVSPHRSEGFGLTVAEAMAIGLPVIATDYGGTADFVTEDLGFPLDYKLVELDRDYGPYGKGSIWADPSRDHLRELLRWICANPRAAAESGRRARARMRERYSAASVGTFIRQRLAAIASGQNQHQFLKG
jgi:glycosyltransferase involved in cell wall biosynthesis